MAARHRARATVIQILKVEVIPASKCRRPHMKQLFVSRDLLRCFSFAFFIQLRSYHQSNQMPHKNIRLTLGLILTLYLLSFVETPRKFSIAILNLRGVSTKLNEYIVFTMQTYKKLNFNLVLIKQSFLLELKDSFPSAAQGDENAIQIKICCQKTKHILLNCKVEMK